MNTTIRNLILISLPLLALSCSTQPKLADQPEGVQALSFFGEPLYSPAPSERALASFENAKTACENNPDDPDLLIAYGRSAVGLGNFRQSIDIFSLGVEKFPDNPIMYRRRGHRYISTRQIPLAIKDLSKAAELIRTDPPADQNLVSDIYYHLGLAHYLAGDFENALLAYQQDYQIANDDPSLAAISNWMYMTLRRLGRDDQAAAILEPIHADMNPGPNAVYHKLLLFYKGELTLDQLQNDPSGGSEDAAILYGIANWFYYNNQTDQALAAFKNILQSNGFAAFGYIAAEADLARLDSSQD